MTTISKTVLSLLAFCAPCIASAASFVFPAGAPTVISTKSPPPWLPSGSGDDGYVTVRADVKMPPVSCATLGSKGLIGNIFQEKMQIVVSLETMGFRTNLDGQRIPIATFDGRSEPGTCTGFNTLPATIIPYARLEHFSAVNPGALSLIFDVRSTTETNANLVSNAQLALGVAGVFATGGAATTVAGLTAAFAKPALTTIEQTVDKSLGEIVKGQSRLDLTWSSLRRGLASVVVPVYVAKTKWMETPAAAMQRSRSAPNPADKLFDVVLTFAYTKTLFDPRVASAIDLPAGDALASASVLNYPRLPGISNFLQLLNSSAPSSLQALTNAKTTGEKAAAASHALALLENAGLNLLDRSIVIKSFIDEARQGPDWYSAGEVNAYFPVQSELKTQLVGIYGAGKVFDIKDTQLGMAPGFNAWEKAVPPILADLRQALTTSVGKAEALYAFNGGTDIDVSFYPNAQSWLSSAPSTNVAPVEADTAVEQNAVDVSVKYPPGLTKLASKGVKKAGCFVYGTDANLDPKNYGGHMIILSDADQPWRVDATLASNGAGKIKKIVLSPLTNDWKEFFVGTTYKGGECPDILKVL